MHISLAQKRKAFYQQHRRKERKMRMISPRTPVAYALKYAERGWSVLPLHSVTCGDCSCGRDTCSSPGKHPRTKNGVKDATTDKKQISDWWLTWPTANIGIATGQASNGLYVLDVDFAKGANLDDLVPAVNISELTDTWTVTTGSGGVHYYMHCDETLPNTAGKLAAFLDTRGEGGYVVAPPSFNKYGQYKWTAVIGEMSPVPADLLALLKKPAGKALISQNPVHEQKKEEVYELSRRTQNTPTPDGQTPGDQAPANVQATGATAGVGAVSPLLREARNQFLIGLVGRLRTAGLALDEIAAALLAINQARYSNGKHAQGPLPTEEIEHTILKSAAKYEAAGGVLPAAVPIVDMLPDLMARVLPPTLWVVPNLLPEGLCLFAGKPKMGKSWLALALALTCAQGTASGGGLVLDRYPVEASGVLYLSLEDSPNRFQSRVEKLLQGRTPPERFGSALDWKPFTLGGMQDLETYLLATPDTRLIVIDTLAKLRVNTGTKGGNIYQEEYQLMGELQSLALRHHVTLMLVHHRRKESTSDRFDSMSGSTGLTGAADTLLDLDRERNQVEATLGLSGRDIDEQELALTFAKETCIWHCTGNVAERQHSQSKQAILDLLAKNGGMSPAEVAKELEKPRAAIKLSLFRMEQEGLIVKQGRGCYALPSCDTHPEDQSMR